MVNIKNKKEQKLFDAIDKLASAQIEYKEAYEAYDGCSWDYYGQPYSDEIEKMWENVKIAAKEYAV